MGLFGKLLGNLVGKTLGETPVPGEGKVQLPRGTVKVNYEEKRMGRSVEDSWSGIPEGLEITLRPAGGGDPLPIDRPRGTNEYAGGGRIGSRYGDVQIPVAGEYVATVAAFEAGYELFEPHLSFKS